MEKWKACQLAFEYFKTNFFVRNKQRINSKRGFKIKIFYIFSFLILTSCFNKNITSLNIRETPLSGKLLTITRLDENYKKTKNFNKIWKNFSNDKFKPHFRLQNKTYKVVGTLKEYKNISIVIEDDRGKRFKKKISSDEIINWPSYVVFDEVLKEAENVIGDTIWLNSILDQEHFYTSSENNFLRFEPVKVKGITLIQNFDSDYPIWLEVESFKEPQKALIRYNSTEGKPGYIDHYFSTSPILNTTNKKFLSNIFNKKIEVGMSERECRISIGNPAIINNTASRHGIGKQYVYKKNNGKNIYYQFEYGKLVHINE